MDDKKRAQVVQMLAEVTGEAAKTPKGSPRSKKTGNPPPKKPAVGGVELIHVKLNSSKDLADVLSAILRGNRRDA